MVLTGILGQVTALLKITEMYQMASNTQAMLREGLGV